MPLSNAQEAVPPYCAPLEALIYFVLLNIFVAIVLDTFSLASRLYAVVDKKNPMIVPRLPRRARKRPAVVARGVPADLLELDERPVFGEGRV